MRILFAVVLVVNLLTEALAATTLISGTEGIAAAGKGGMWSMHYGFAALAIASASLWVWPHRSSLRVVTAVLGILCTFHAGLFISLTLAGDQKVGMVIHGVMALACIALFTQRAKWCE